MSDETSDSGPFVLNLPPAEDIDESRPAVDFPIPNASASKRRGRPIAKTTAAKDKPKSPLPPKRKGQFVEPLIQLYGFAGLALLPVDPICGAAIIKAAPACAEALDELAYRNEAVRRVLHTLVSGSAVGAVIAAHIPILIAIARHHVPGVEQNAGAMLDGFSSILGGVDDSSAAPEEKAA